MKLTIAYRGSATRPRTLSLAGEFAGIQQARELAIIEAQSTLGKWCTAFEIRDAHDIVLSRWEKPPTGTETGAASADVLRPPRRAAAER